MSKHTPGPWFASPYEGFGPMTTVRQGCPKTGMRIASTFETTTPVHIERSEANARLIAAAPELLEAIQLILDQVDYTNGACSMAEMVGACLDARFIDQARNAIAKARGEA